MGDLNPQLVIQHGANQCLSACLYSIAAPGVMESLGFVQETITEKLESAGLANETGAGLHVSQDLNIVIKSFGLEAKNCFRVWGLDDDDLQKAENRLTSVTNSLADNEKVVIAFTWGRGGNSIPFTHYVVVSGYEMVNGNEVYVVMDPSEIDGEVRKLTKNEMLEYLTPKSGLPVAGWSIRNIELWPEGKGTNLHGSMQPRFDSRLELPGSELLESPMFSSEHLGLPIPTGTDHPISVAMPTCIDVDQWGQYGDSVLSVDGNRPHGYPRFVIDPWVRELAVQTMGSIDWLPFPTQADAQSATYLATTYSQDTSAIVEKNGLFWLKESGGDGLNRDAWQFCGLGLSSRQARATLEGRSVNDIEARGVAQESIKQEISLHTGARHDDIYLFPTGMASVHMVNEILKAIYVGAPSVQFGFPYTDTFAIERRFGPDRNATRNVVDIRDCDLEILKTTFIGDSQVRGVFTEWPTNPKLYVPPLDEIASIVNGSVPIIIDDTVGTMFNLDSEKIPSGVDIRLTSLTKYFSSVGDVMGGAIVLSPSSPHYAMIKDLLDRAYVDKTWFEDVQILARNSQYFREFMPVINDNGHQLAHWLHDEYSQGSDLIDHVYYPSITDKEEYDKYRSSNGGYGGLLSLDFADPETAYRFFDALEVTKGPSLGTYYSLACLYTKLAHKNELATAAKFGVKEHLIRFSAGIEPFEVLQQRFEKAIEIAKRK